MEGIGAVNSNLLVLSREVDGKMDTRCKVLLSFDSLNTKPKMAEIAVLIFFVFFFDRLHLNTDDTMINIFLSFF